MLEARARQTKRFGHKGPLVNGRMTPRQLRKLCQLKPEAMSILKAAMEELGLSAWAHDKVLRVARTIADLEGSDEIKPQHIAGAVGYRSLDRSVWMYSHGRAARGLLRSKRSDSQHALRDSLLERGRRATQEVQGE
ncbi:MAG: hypothetical protein ABSH35_17715 [Isosphaeraceae bacterium]